MIATANEPIPISDLRLFPALFAEIGAPVDDADVLGLMDGPDDGGGTTVPTGIFPGVVPVDSAGDAPAAAPVGVAAPAGPAAPPVGDAPPGGAPPAGGPPAPASVGDGVLLS